MRHVKTSAVLSKDPSGSTRAGRTLSSQTHGQPGSLPIPELSPYSFYQAAAIK